MYDFIYDEGHVVAYIKLGFVYTETIDIKVATVSGGKIFSFTGQLVGHVRNATSMSTNKSLWLAFRKLLDSAA